MAYKPTGLLSLVCYGNIIMFHCSRWPFHKHKDFDLDFTKCCFNVYYMASPSLFPKSQGDCNNGPCCYIMGNWSKFSGKVHTRYLHEMLKYNA